MNPAVIQQFGSDVCKANLISRIDPTGSFTVVGVGQIAPFDWVLPDNSTVHFDAAQQITIDITHNGTTQQADSHFVDIDGQFSWFTYCK